MSPLITALIAVVVFLVSVTFLLFIFLVAKRVLMLWQDSRPSPFEQLIEALRGNQNINHED